MNVLVTGCAGYVGTVLCGKLIALGHRVVGVDNLMWESGPAMAGLLREKKFSFRRLDVVADCVQVARLARGCDAAVPLAALVGAPLCEWEPHRAEAVNREAVRRLVGGLSPSQRVVYPNTNSGYGRQPSGRAVTEEDPMAPLSLYGATKCDAEHAVLEHPGGCSLRLATVFGVSPRMRYDLLLNDFTQQLARGNSLRVFDGGARRNAVGVGDVARAFAYALENEWAGPYNLANPRLNLTKLEFAHAVCDALGVPRGSVSQGEGRDPDQRDCAVSSDKVAAKGFLFLESLPDGVAEVAALARVTAPQDLARMRNA